jgi:hypothetical protein
MKLINLEKEREQQALDVWTDRRERILASLNKFNKILEDERKKHESV